MITQKKIKTNCFFMLMLSIVFFVSAFFVSKLFNQYNSPQSVTSRLNSGIALAFNNLDKEIDKIEATRFNKQSDFLNYLDKNYKTAFEKKGIVILIYEQDSLKYWSDNVVAAPRVFENKNEFPTMLISGNGYYLEKISSTSKRKIVALQLIRYNYKYTNEYLPFSFFKKFNVPENVHINLDCGEFNITSPNGTFLFSLSFEQPFELKIWLQYLIFSLYITSFLCLVSAIFILYLILFPHIRLKGLLIIGFIIDIIILRAIQFNFKFPTTLYEIQLFKPEYFASSDLLPSLGDFLINTLIGLQLIFLNFKYSTIWVRRKKKVSGKYKVIASLLLLAITILYYFLVTTISGLILNSSISFSAENILSLPQISYVGLMIISTLLLGFLFILELVIKLYVSWQHSMKLYIINVILCFLFFLSLNLISGNLDFFTSLFLIVLLVVLYFQVRVKSFLRFRFSRLTTVVITLSALATYLVIKTETIREHEKRNLVAIHLAYARDNLAEYYFSEASRSMQHDSVLSRYLSITLKDTSLNDVSHYIKEKYFSGYWNKHLIQITVCQPDKKLNIKPGNIITGCEEYFDSKINQFMKPVSVPGLYFLRQSVDAMYYLGKVVLNTGKAGNERRNTIFVEISSNDIWKGLGYPELLIDTKSTNSDNLFDYSYAFYYKGELVKNVGKFSYDIENGNIREKSCNQKFFDYKGYNHLVYNVDQNTMIILSKETPRFTDLIAPFSYIFLLLVAMLFLTNWLSGSVMSWKIGIYTFRLRLQVIMISVIVVSSVVLVTVSLLFINNLNRNKNNEILSEKLNSVLVDIETRYDTIHAFDVVSNDELSDLLLNLSNTYFTDINIFDSKGFLIASSRDQIFREGMISEQINTSAARQLMVDKKSFLIQRENIGYYSYLSAYTPIRNIDNHLLGYLNLPYFARQEEIKREISGLISAFANIYIIMIVITILLALLLSRYITKPLQHIGYQFSKVKMGDQNAKIVWRRKDEIGRLVHEYNRMIDEMERSADLLARSERESAWRLMARQVAHEIKNPLTPIKLNMQLLMRAWNDKVPDWDDRLKRFSQTLIMQIDTLSAIATEFSDFAQMPEPQIQSFDVIPLLQQSASLFRDQSDCEIIFESSMPECLIKADPNQILRVFNNLIKNALQAIPRDRNGIIRINLVVVDQNCEISFEDNGTGIPIEKQARIFSPNFTTKTAGMGLGLAMVKNIIDNTNGRIWFETDMDKGTTFFICLPLKESELT